MAEVIGYTRALKSGPDKRRAHTYVGRGNAYLACGRAKLALLDYGFALKLKDPDILALKGEALMMLGRHQQAMR